MSNQTEPDATRLPPEARRRLKLIEDIRRVAEEIVYRGRGDTERLAVALDNRGIRPLRANIPSWKGYWGGKWLGVHPYATQKLLLFIKRWLPDLLEHGTVSIQSVPTVKVTCLCAKCGLSETDACKRQDETKRRPSRPDVTHGTVTHVTHTKPEPSGGLHGWTLSCDKRGVFKLVKRIGGRLTSIYLGKSNAPELVKEKIRQWTERQGNRP